MKLMKLMVLVAAFAATGCVTTTGIVQVRTWGRTITPYGSYGRIPFVDVHVSAENTTDYDCAVRRGANLLFNLTAKGAIDKFVIRVDRGQSAVIVVQCFENGAFIGSRAYEVRPGYSYSRYRVPTSETFISITAAELNVPGAAPQGGRRRTIRYGGSRTVARPIN